MPRCRNRSSWGSTPMMPRRRPTWTSSRWASRRSVSSKLPPAAITSSTSSVDAPLGDVVGLHHDAADAGIVHAVGAHRLEHAVGAVRRGGSGTPWAGRRRWSPADRRWSRGTSGMSSSSTNSKMLRPGSSRAGTPTSDSARPGSPSAGAVGIDDQRDSGRGVDDGLGDGHLLDLGWITLCQRPLPDSEPARPRFALRRGPDSTPGPRPPSCESMTTLRGQVPGAAR